MCFSPCSVFLTDKNVCCQLWFEKEKTLCKLDQPLSTSESSPFSMGILFCSGLNPPPSPHIASSKLLLFYSWRLKERLYPSVDALVITMATLGKEPITMDLNGGVLNIERQHRGLSGMRIYPRVPPMAWCIASYGIAVNSFWQLIQFIFKGILPGSVEDIITMLITTKKYFLFAFVFLCSFVFCVFAFIVLCKPHLSSHDWSIMYNACMLLVKQMFSHYHQQV